MNGLEEDKTDYLRLELLPRMQITSSFLVLHPLQVPKMKRDGITKN